MKKLTTLLVMLLFAAGMAIAQTNESTVDQVGNNNQSNINQTGYLLDAFVNQAGNQNIASIAQEAEGSSPEISQRYC